MRHRFVGLLVLVVALAATACTGTGGAGGASLGGGSSGGGRSGGASSGQSASASGDPFNSFSAPNWDNNSANDNTSTGGASTSDGGLAGSSSGATSAGSSGASGSTAASSSGTGTSGGTGSSTAEALSGAAGNKVFVLGDSVLLAAKDMLPAEMPGWAVTVDAKVSRRIDAGLTVLEQNQSAIGAVVVIHLCTNYAKGEGFAAKLDRAMQLVEKAARVVLVTCVPWSDGPPEANAIIAAAPQKYPKVRVADWAKISQTPGYAGSDGIHLLPPGVIAIAKLIADQVGPAPGFSGPDISTPDTSTPDITIPDIGN